MAVQKILTIHEPVLYQTSDKIEKFDSSLRSLVRDLFDTMKAAKGVGLAAVQIGILKRVLVIDLVEQGHAKGAFVNPHIIEQSKEMQHGEEGCLSVPGLSAELARPRQVKIGYQDLSGQKKTIEAEMLMARALLHEMDHLDGKVFVDQLEPDLRLSLAADINLIKDGKELKKISVPDYRKS